MRSSQRASFIVALAFVLVATASSCLAQDGGIKGGVYDELTRKPVGGANIRIYGTGRGTSTGANGTFNLAIDSLPVTLVISCVGYESTFFDILEEPGKPVRFYLKPVTYNLREVEITSSDHRFIFSDRDYSVLDYELAGDRLFLLVFRNLRRESEMVVLSLSGDTLATAALPETPPLKLYRDFISNIHYYCVNGTTYQCHADTENESIDFLFPVPFDSLEKYVRPFLFRIGDRIYFQQKVFNNFGTRIGYGSRDSGQVYLKSFINTRKINELRDDHSFYYQWSNAYETMRAESLPKPKRQEFPENPEFNFSKSQAEEARYGTFEAAAHWFEYYNMLYPFLRINNDTLVFIDFSNGIMELLDRDGRVLKKNPISFHRAEGNNSNSGGGWRWGGLMLQDDITGALYTGYEHRGMVKLCRVDYRTGKAGAETVIPYPFPDKFRICGNMAYYLCKPAGAGENRRLIRSRVK
jgi:hypothetical protein